MPTTREFRNGDHVIVVRESGIADGPDYVLVHGLGMAHEYWGDLAVRLEATGTVYALDMPGFGDAPQPRAPLSMEASGKLLAEFLIAEGLDHPVLVGHSTGAQVASETAARHPELVGRLVLIGSTVNPRERTILKQSLRFLQDIAVINPKVMAIGLAQYSEAGPRWFAANLRPMLEHRLERVLPLIAADTLVIRGEHDRIVPRYWAEEMAALLPKGRYAEVPGRGHDTMLTGVSEVFELISRHARGESVGREVPTALPIEAPPAAPPRPLSPLAAGGWWALDYLDAARRHARVLTVPRPPRRWGEGDPAMPTIVLLPGVYEHWSFMAPLGDALNAHGHRVRVVHGLGANLLAIPETAERVTRALLRLPTPTAGRILVGHSKGGLVGKRMLIAAAAGGTDERLGLLGVVAVATPFGGSRLARYMLDRRLREFLPDGETIVELGDAASVNSRIVSVFGTYDPHVPEGSALDGATNVQVPVAGHFRILAAPETIAAVVAGVELLAQSTDESERFERSRVPE